MKAASRWVSYGWALVATALCTAVGFAITPHFDLVNVAMIYMLAVVFIARQFSRGPAAFTTVLCVAAFDVLFVPPRGTFSVEDTQYLLTFVIMLTVGLVIASLVDNVRRQAAKQALLEVEAETQRIRGVLLASISHDLRTPLAVMSGASSSLAESGERMTAAERRALATSVCEQAQDMSELITKVLQMTRLDSGAITLDHDWVSLGEMGGSVLDRLAMRMSRHRVIVDLPQDLPLLRVDAVLIEQALGNLLENAATHTPPGTVVRLSAETRAAEVIVTVEDYAKGISEGDADRLFDKFNRTSEGTRSGVGLGLAICRAIIGLHGGKAWAERLPAGGSAFRFSIPLHEVPSVPADPAVVGR